MKLSPSAPKSDQQFELSLFCGQVGDAWRIHVWPGWLPPFLRNCFDEEGEAFPVYIDIDELDREMKLAAFDYVRKDSPIGGLELSAKGDAAGVLARWLSQSFASGRRDVSTLPDDESSTKNQGFTG